MSMTLTLQKYKKRFKKYISKNGTQIMIYVKKDEKKDGNILFNLRVRISSMLDNFIVNILFLLARCEGGKRREQVFGRVGDPNFPNKGFRG